MNAAGVVAALASEAKALGSPVRMHEGCGVLADGTLIAVSGMGPAAARLAAERLIGAGAAGLISWGLAGGLDPALMAGTLCLPREVIGEDGRRFATTRSWRESIMAALGPDRKVAEGTLLTRDRPVAGVASKAELRRETGAEAVDMESAAVAQIAAAHAVPFIAVRVVVDTAVDAIPGSVARASESGEVRIGRLLRGLIGRPGEIASLVRLARRYRSAMRSLGIAAAGLGRAA